MFVCLYMIIFYIYTHHHQLLREDRVALMPETLSWMTLPLVLDGGVYVCQITCGHERKPFVDPALFRVRHRRGCHFREMANLNIS